MSDITDANGYNLTDFVIGTGVSAALPAGTINQLGPIKVTPSVGTRIVGVCIDDFKNLHIVTLNPL